MARKVIICDKNVGASGGGGHGLKTVILQCKTLILQCKTLVLQNSHWCEWWGAWPKNCHFAKLSFSKNSRFVKLSMVQVMGGMA